MIKSALRVLFQNPVLANLMMLLIVCSGIIGATMMIREIFPRFSRDSISVTVAYPGADPEEVEEGICLKLEEALEGIEGIKEITTLASEGSGTATLECEEGADLYEVKDEVKTLVDAITTFPKDAESPIVKEVKFRGNVLALVVSGDIPERQLKELGREIEQELLQIDGLSQISIGGIRDYEISIDISEEKLRKYGLTFSDISNAIVQNSINQPAGTIRTDSEELRIRALGRRYKAKDYRNIPIIKNSDGTLITLGQLAKIRDSFDEDTKVEAFFDGKPAVSINIFKTEEEDSIKISDACKAYVKKKQAELPEGVKLSIFRNNARMIISRLDLLLNNGQIGLLLVFFSLWLFLDLRLSFWVTMGIPISLAGGLVLMAAVGCTINMLSMFGLIMVLGLIVDDAIVIGESIYAKRQAGESCIDAAINGTSEVALPVVAAVLTTIVAFLPLFFIGGVMGKFIRQIPIPVIAALSFSLIEGLFILPVHLRHLPMASVLPKRKIFRIPYHMREYTAGGLNKLLENYYGPFLDKALHWRYAALCIGLFVMMVMFGLYQSGLIKFVFFPPADEDYIRAKVEFPEGTPVSETRAAAKTLRDSWRKTEAQFKNRIPKDKDLTQSLFAIVGGSTRFGSSKGSNNELEVAIELLPSEERNIHYRKLVDVWQKNTGNIPGVIACNFESFHHGPGGDPIEIKLMGDDQDQLLDAADKLLAKLNSIKGIFDGQVDYRPGKREFIVDIKPEAYHHGFSLSDIASHVHHGFYGQEALRIQRDRDDIKVKVRYPENNGRDSIEYFQKLRIKTPKGQMVPFMSVANIKLANGPSTIRRENRHRYVTVSSDVNDKEANAKEIITEIETNYMPKLLAEYPGMSYSTEGQAEERRDSMGSLLISFPLALFGIYFIIASMFRSYVQPIVIMTTIPFGLIGGIIGHMFFGLPITMMSLFGLIALAGIVVNDAIVLIEGVNVRLAEGFPLFEALREGGKRRFRAILLTTLTTFAGLMPLILEKSMQAQFLIPMAISIAFGVLFATVLTLVLIPCLIAILNDFRCLSHYLWFGNWPSREAVEPRAKTLE
jgi:multidrug efflux pump subunit AcrB